ncbi:flagellar biosynthetic protein FliO [Pseudoduganella danionis]|uniref:Flagellar protein n=1 Tax=Pseudoduganella danionis TaxID=1890295 RepID=A0ABW9SMR0_9BURK|nr:flagellar biosynthetic protein FliO [Pseudoduganella danionis]MTW31947.1 flagellar biosynthetic protein FliO [Pseudoduganella danionis]
MKRGLTLTLLIAAALAAAPAIAQHRVSGTIGGQHGASAHAAAASTPAAAAASSAATPAAAAAASETTQPAPATASAAPAAGLAASAAAPAASVAAPPGPLAMTIPTPAPAPTSSGGLLQTTMALLFVLAVLVGLAWLLKRFGPKHLTGSQRHIKLVDSLNLGARERILLLEVGEQWVLVGASAGRMNALTTLPRQELPPEEANPDSTAKPNFAAWLKQTIEQRHGK